MKNYEWYGDKVIQNVDNAKKGGLTAACKVVQGAAALLIRNVTGGLAGSITYKVDGDDARVGTNVDYAPYVEFGTGKHAEGGKGRKTPWVYKHPKYGFIRTEGSPARPFLRPALDNNRDALQRMIGDAISKAVK